MFILLQFLLHRRNPLFPYRDSKGKFLPKNPYRIQTRKTRFSNAVPFMVTGKTTEWHQFNNWCNRLKNEI